jgi:hypothetical protein
MDNAALDVHGGGGAIGKSSSEGVRLIVGEEVALAAGLSHVPASARSGISIDVAASPPPPASRAIAYGVRGEPRAPLPSPLRGGSIAEAQRRRSGWGCEWQHLRSDPHPARGRVTAERPSPVAAVMSDSPALAERGEPAAPPPPIAAFIVFGESEVKRTPRAWGAGE